MQRAQVAGIQRETPFDQGKQRVEPDCAWLTIKRPGLEARYVEVQDRDVPALVAEFQAIGEDPEKFKAFVNAARGAMI